MKTSLFAELRFLFPLLFVTCFRQQAPADVTGWTIFSNNDDLVSGCQRSVWGKWKICQAFDIEHSADLEATSGEGIFRNFLIKSKP